MDNATIFDHDTRGLKVGGRTCNISSSPAVDAPEQALPVAYNEEWAKIVGVVQGLAQPRVHLVFTLWTSEDLI